MSDRGDDRGDDLPPADPWGLDSDPSDPEETAPGDRREGRRGLWRRRRSDPGEPSSEPEEDEDDADATELFDSLATDSDAPGEPRGDEEVVDSPVWAGDAPTLAADHIRAEGFEDEAASGESEPAEAESDRPRDLPGQDPLFLPGADDDEALPEPDHPEAGGRQPAREASDDWSTELAERSPYGVPTSDALSALSDDDPGDLEDWDSFAGDEAVDVPSDPLEAAGDLADDLAAAAEVPMSRRERRRARREAKRAARAGEVEGDADGGDDVPEWVEGGPEETAWLDEGVDDLESLVGSGPGLPGAAASGDDALEDDVVEDGRDDMAADQATESAVAGDELDEGRWTPSSDEGPVWLAADQPLVGDEPVAGGPQPPVGPDDEQDFEEAAADDEDDVDAWVTGPVGYAAGTPEAGHRPGDGEDGGEVGDDIEITEDLYAQSATLEHRGLAEEIFRAGDQDLEWQAVSAAMPGLGTGVVGWDDVADLGAEEDEYVERAPSDLGARIATGFILVGLLLGSLWVGSEAFAAFIGLLVLIALGEYYTALRMRRLRPMAIFGYLGGLGLLVGAWYHGPTAIAVGLVLTTVVIFFAYAFAPLGRDALSNGGLTVLGVAWVAATAAFAFPIVRADGFRVLVLAVVAVTAAMDVGAFAVGRMWGSLPLAPVVSPNKSVEGLLGGVVAAFGAALGVAALFEEIATSDALLLAGVVVALAPIGDLAESMLKRSLQLKDMGSILPGHGGVLDRIDAFLFVLPGVWVLFKVLGLIG